MSVHLEEYDKKALVRLALINKETNEVEEELGFAAKIRVPDKEDTDEENILLITSASIFPHNIDTRLDDIVVHRWKAKTKQKNPARVTKIENHEQVHVSTVVFEGGDQKFTHAMQYKILTEQDLRNLKKEGKKLCACVFESKEKESKRLGPFVYESKKKEKIIVLQFEKQEGSYKLSNSSELNKKGFDVKRAKGAPVIYEDPTHHYMNIQRYTRKIVGVLSINNNGELYPVLFKKRFLDVRPSSSDTTEAGPSGIDKNQSGIRNLISQSAEASFHPEGSSTVSIQQVDKSLFTNTKEFIKEQISLKLGEKVDEFFGSYENFALRQPQHQVFLAEVERIFGRKHSIGAIIALNVSNVIGCTATCFRIGNKYVITNKHVIVKINELAIPCSRCYVDFDYETKAPLPAADSSLLNFVLADSQFRFNFASNPEKVSSKELDYAILELNPEGRCLPPGLVDLDSGFNIAPPLRQLQDEDCLTFIGHPGGFEKQIDLSCPIKLQQDIQDRLTNDHLVCLVQDSYNIQHRVNYDVSTFFEGSSGSPGFLIKKKLLVVLQSGGITFEGTNKPYVLEYGTMMSSVVKDVMSKVNHPTVENLTRALDEFFGGKTSSTFIQISEPMDTTD